MHNSGSANLTIQPSWHWQLGRPSSMHSSTHPKPHAAQQANDPAHRVAPAETSATLRWQGRPTHQPPPSATEPHQPTSQRDAAVAQAHNLTSNRLSGQLLAQTCNPNSKSGKWFTYSRVGARESSKTASKIDSSQATRDMRKEKSWQNYVLTVTLRITK